MTRRADKPDTAADVQLRELLDSNDLPAFTMIAGAGSGKTTSLVKALVHIAEERGAELRRRAQRVACITYTEVAASEIFVDIGETPVSHVSTIHSFLWSVVGHFRHDIATWAETTLQRKLDGAKSFSDRERYSGQIRKLKDVKTFRYGFGPNLGDGILGHEDVIQMSCTLLANKPLLRTLLARRYPIVFVDESQDTFPDVVTALKLVREQMGVSFCLGFFGDPMQKIYSRGVGPIELGPGWQEIEKLENFRSPRRVLEVMNSIRNVADGLQQESGLDEDAQIDGQVEYFVLPADDNRTENLQRVRDYLDSATSENSWAASNHFDGAKTLVIAHRMAAKRLGFENLYAAFHDTKARSLSQSFDDGSAWPMRIIMDRILPLVEFGPGQQLKDLKEFSPLFAQLRDNDLDPRVVLTEIRQAIDHARQIYLDGGGGSIGRLVNFAHNSGLIEFDDRLAAFTGDGRSADSVPESTTRALTALFECDVREVAGYRRYLSNDSPYSTQQGVKGAEFSRVIVVLDDSEGRHVQFSYDKLFGLEPPSSTDKNNAKIGKETTFERTRRLLYVCVSRTTEALAVVLYSSNPARAADALREFGLPCAETIMTIGQEGAVTRI